MPITDFQPMTIDVFRALRAKDKYWSGRWNYLERVAVCAHEFNP